MNEATRTSPSAADWVETTNPLVRQRKEGAYLAELEAYRADSWRSA